jgi:hypothetical protein
MSWFSAVPRDFEPASPNDGTWAGTIAGDPQCARVARREDPQMELAALLFFGSIALWLIGEASGPHHL